MLAALSGGLGLPLFIFWAWTAFDVISSDKNEIRRYNKPIWLVILAFGWMIGAISWYLVGRPRKSSAAPGETTPGTNDESSPTDNAIETPVKTKADSRPRGPEDDDAWLASITMPAPADPLVLGAANDFAAWEDDFTAPDSEETDQDSGSNA